MSQVEQFSEEDIVTPRDAEGYQRKIELAILAYLELRCGCGRAATAGPQVCPVCYAAREADRASQGDGVRL